MKFQRTLVGLELMAVGDPGQLRDTAGIVVQAVSMCMCGCGKRCLGGGEADV